MARSRYIYVVQDDNDKVLATFTVKHEMLASLDRFFSRRANANKRIRCWRYPDGPWGFDEAPYLYTDKELFE